MTETFPGYASLVGSESLSLNDFHVQSPGDYNMWQLIVVTAKKGKVWSTKRQVVAYINHGRWIVDCAWCTRGMLTRPDWGIANCIQCGARYDQGTIAFPADENIVRALLIRPIPETQNWDEKQTAADLWRENKELGL